MTPEVGRPPRSGRNEHVRRARLPADRRTPSAARAIVRAVLTEAGLEELLNEALLLATELTTNAVMHARTELDIEVIADADGLSVLVTDFAPGPLKNLTIAPVNGQTDISQVSERGRGLLLVDHFATRWGTTHLPGGKSVWFRLDRKVSTEPDPPPAAAGPEAPAVTEPDSTPTPGAIAALMQAAPDPHSEDPLPAFAADLLARLAELVGAESGIVQLDRGDGAGKQPLARYGRQPLAGNDRLRLPLTVNRPYAGELELDTFSSGYARPLAALAAERLSLHLENDRLRRADIRRQAWLAFLAEASELLAQSLDVELTMALIPQLVVPRLGRWCAVHTIDEWGQLRLAATTHADESMLPELYAVLEETGPDSMQARLREASRTGSQVAIGAPPMDGFAVPLTARGQRLGILAVGRHLQQRHDSDEVAVLEDIARRSALAIENARIHDERRRVAQTLQQSLLPPVLPVVDGIGFAAEYVPSGHDANVGGDFYDVLPLPDGRWLAVIGDVSGKGVQAAAVTGLVRDVLRVLVGDGRSLPKALGRLNRTLLDRGGGRYCTLALAAVGWGSDEQLEVSLYLAGHHQPVLVRADGSAFLVGQGGTALGLLDSISSPVTHTSLQPGEALVFYTDGVTERRRGRELFGVERLRKAAAPLAGYSAEVLAAQLRAAAIGFSVEPPRDDIAIMVIRNDKTG
ncbi:MAG TPA: SpoIIE family protein phosphatase [Micromonosporaceae bacterium]|nr:SpoIIE family protein phosphatase [Micromonosporaceae bacterium]